MIAHREPSRTNNLRLELLGMMVTYRPKVDTRTELASEANPGGDRHCMMEFDGCCSESPTLAWLFASDKKFGQDLDGAVR